MKYYLSVLIIFVSVMLNACTSVRSYVDPGFQRVSISDLNPNPDRPTLGVLVEFQREGLPFPQATGSARQAVIAVLEESKLFSSVSSGTVNTTAQIKITIDNLKGESRGSGTATGLTMGLVGTTAIDPYVFKISYQMMGKEITNKEYQHKLYTLIGVGSVEDGAETMQPSEGFSRVIQDVILKCLKDLQTGGEL